MANRYAVANGNWSSTSTWDGGTLPTSADDVFANGFTVTIDQNVTVLSLRTTLIISAGGGFSISSSFNITADIYSGTTTCLTSTGGAGTTVNITGNLYGSTTSTNGSIRALNHTGAGTVNITGDLIGGTGASGSQRIAVRWGGTGILNINGNITGNSGNTHFGLSLESIGTVNVTGNLLTNGNAAISTSSGTLTVTGTLISGSVALISASATNVTINGNQSVSSGTTAGLVNLATSGTLTINGSITNSSISVSGTNAINISNAANLIVNGDLNMNAVGTGNHTVVTIGGTGTHIITGNCTRNSIGGVLTISGLNRLTINGNLSSTFNSNRATVSVSGSTIVNINGNITGNIGGSNQNGNLTLGGTGLTTINGNITGGTGGSESAVVVTNASTSNIIVNGTITAGTGLSAHGIFHLGSGTITVNRVTGNSYGVGSSGIGEAYAIHNNNSLTIFGEIIVTEFEFGSRGMCPVRGHCRISPVSGRQALFRDSTGTQITLVDPSVIITPPEVYDVRSGVIYNNGNLAGTLIVPSFDNVANNIPVDSGVGTAVLKPENVWDYMRNNITVSGSIGERLKNTATIQSVGDQIAAF
jgi:hypothetical protein